MRKLKNPVICILIFFSLSGCSWHVHESNGKYAHPVNEINQSIQMLYGDEFPTSYSFDNINGHRHFRISGMLENNNERNLDIFIPKNNDTGRPVVQENNNIVTGGQKDSVNFYLSLNKENSLENESYNLPVIILYIEKKEKDEEDFFSVNLPNVFLSFIAENCIPSEEECCDTCIQPQGNVCVRKWKVDPQLQWQKRNKLTLWAMRSRYLLTVPVDAAAIALFAAIADSLDNDD